MQTVRAIACLAITCLSGLAGTASETIAPPRNIELALGSHLEQPLVVYDRDPIQPCFADYIPTVEEVDATSKVQLATNEYEPLQLGLYVPSNRSSSLQDVKIEVRCELPHSVGYIYYESRARRRVLDYGRPYDHRRPSMPLYVVPGDLIHEIQPGHSGAFWVTFGDRHGIEPGVYAASITISANKIASLQREVEIRVFPFALPRPRAAFGCYFRVDRIPVYNSLKYQQLYVRDQAEHGHNCAQVISYYSAFGSDEFQQDGKVPRPAWIEPWRELHNPADVENGKVDPVQFLDAQMQIFRKSGLTQSDTPVFGVQDNPAGPRKQLVAETLRRLTVQKQWPEILLYMRDEPPAWFDDTFDEEFVEHITQYKRLPQCRSAAAMGGESAVAWGHLHDVWIVLGGYPTPEMVREAARQGAEVWTYLHDLRITNALANRYFAGLYTWGLGIQGNVPYAYHHGEVGQPHPVYLPLERRPSREQVLGFILPGPSGPIPGVGYEGRREGIDDYRYLQLLEARVESADVGSDGKLIAQNWLSQLKRQVNRASLRGVLLNFVTVWDLDWLDPDPEIAPSQYRTIREVAARLIMQLPPAAGEANSPVAPLELPGGRLEGAQFDGKSLGVCQESLENGTTSEKRAAACAISMRNADELASFPADGLVDLLDEPDVRIPALRALRAMGPAATAALPKIEAQLHHEDSFVRMHALLTLDTIGPKAIRAMAASVTDSSPSVAVLAALALERKGPAAASALPVLQQALQSPNPRVRNQAVAAARAIRGESN